MPRPLRAFTMTLVATALYEGLVYGILLIVGGVVGYSKARSRPSLYAGFTSGAIALIFTYFGLRGHDLLALFLLAAEAILLAAFFYTRFNKTGKFMPAGLMTVISGLSLVLYLAAIILA